MIYSSSISHAVNFKFQHFYIFGIEDLDWSSPPIKKFNWILPPFLFWVHRNETSNVLMKKLALIFVCKICFFLFPKWRFSFKNFLSTAAIWASNQFFLDLSTLSNTHNIWAMESQTQMQKSVDRQKSCLQKYEWLKWRKMISFPPHFI